MKISKIHIDAFGVWNGLTLRDLSTNCTVFYGANEAGKTTVMQFLRSMLYGFTPVRRARYVTPLGGQPAGGYLSAIAEHDGRMTFGGEFTIRRNESAQQPLGTVAVQRANGSVVANQLNSFLHEIDEATYQNVFAIGLLEIQEFNTLNELDASRWLYALSAGLDRVSLFDVLSDLENSRAKLVGDRKHLSIAGTHHSGEIGELLAKREKIQRELENCGEQLNHYRHSVEQRTQAEHETERLQASLTHAQAEHRTLEAAALVFETWQRRAGLRTQIEMIGPCDALPNEAQHRMQRFGFAIRKRRRQFQGAIKQRQQLAQEFDQISLNENLWQQSARIAAIVEHEAWAVSLEQELSQTESDLKSASGQRQAEQERFKAAAGSVGDKATTGFEANLKPGQLNSRTWAILSEPAAVLARRRAKAAHEKVQQQQQTVQSHRRDVENALAAKGQKHLPTAVETAGQRVTQLRNRIQLEERLKQLASVKANLDDRVAELTKQQILPPQWLVMVGGVFVLGVVFVFSGLLLPETVTAGWGWPLFWIGILTTGSAVSGKFLIERWLAAQLIIAEKQLEMTEAQTSQVQSQCEELEQVLPKGGGPLVTRLQMAEQELARLEALLPLDAKRQSAEQEVGQTNDFAALAMKKYRIAKRRWHAALSTAGLPETLNPKQAKAMTERGSQLGVAENRLADTQTDLDRRRRELQGLATRVEQIFIAAGLQPQAAKASERLRQLRRELSEEDARRQRRDSIRKQQKSLARRTAAIKERIARLKRRRQQLLADCRASDLADFHRRAEELAKLATLRSEYDAADREIAAVLAGMAAETAIAPIVDGKTSEHVDQSLAASKRTCEDLQLAKRRAIELSGQIAEQIKQLANDRRAAEQRYELAQIERQLQSAVNRWQVLTVTERLLQQVKCEHERDRQPETLREASEYLSRLTGGKYIRVWRPLGDAASLAENKLLVDDATGRSLPPEALSHGTREQLFLSLRLALVSLFARRGASLPMVLDDVLVNFDTDRANAAVQVLRDFSEQGHQLLIFTCHEHIARMFKRAQVDVRRLPQDRHNVTDLPFDIEEEPPLRVPPRPPKIEVKEEPIAPPPPVFIPPAPLHLVSSTTVHADIHVAPLVIEALPPAPVEMYYVEPPSEPLPVIKIEKPAPAPEPQLPIYPRLRIDSPQVAVRLSPIFRRWPAEEFNGELDDQVNPRWLWQELNGLEPMPVPGLARAIAVQSNTPGIHSNSLQARISKLEDVELIAETLEFDTQSQAPFTVAISTSTAGTKKRRTLKRRPTRQERLDEEAVPIIIDSLPADDDWEL